jgi:hypothetical protein
VKISESCGRTSKNVWKFDDASFGFIAGRAMRSSYPKKFTKRLRTAACILRKRNTEAMVGPPRNAAMMGDMVAQNHKIERVRDAKRAFDFEACAGCRYIAHRAADAAGTVELNRACLEYPVPGTGPTLVHCNLAVH